MNWLRVAWITGLAVVLLGVAHRVYGAEPDITQYIKDHYRYGTLFQHNKSYMDVYQSSTNRNLSLTNLKVSEERISGFYKVTLKDKSGEYKSETGVMVFHIKDGIPIREEHVLVKEEVLSKYTHDLALSGQMADVVTTAAALAAGGIEANPIVSGLIGSPVGAVAWVGMKVALVYAPEYLSLKECIEAKKGIGTAGWALAGLNIGAFVHPFVGLMAAVVAGTISYEGLEKTAAIACVA